MSRAITKGVICMADVSVDIGVKIDESGIKKGLASMGKMIASEIGEVVKIIGSLGVHAVKTGDEFGTAMSQITSDMGNTANQITEFTETAREMGASAKLAASESVGQLTTLDDDISALKSSFSGLKGSIGDALSAPLQEGVQFAAEQIGILQEAFTNGGFEGLASVMEEVLSNVTAKMAEYLPRVIESGITMITSIGSALESALPIIAESIPVILNTIFSILTAAAPELIKCVGDVVSSLVASLPEIISVLVSALPGLISTIIECLLETSQALLDAVIQIVMAVVDALPQIILMIVEILPELIQSICDGLMEFLPMVIEAGITLLSSIIQELPTIINNIVMVLPSIIESIIGALLEMLPLIVDCGVQLLVSLVQALPDIIYAIVAVLPVIIASIISTLIGMKMLIIQCGMDLLVSLIGALPDIILSLVTAAPKIINGIITALLSNIPLIIQSGIKLFTSLITAIPDIIKTLIGAIPQIITALVNAFRNYKNGFIETGRNLFLGVADGIVSAVSTVLKSVRESCGKILSSVKSFFGIHSPSRLFKEVIGENLMFGLAEGIDSEAKSAISSMSDVAKEIAGTEFGADTSNLFDDADSIVKRLKYEIDDSNDFVSKAFTAKAVSSSSIAAVNSDNAVNKSENPQYIENNLIIDGRKAARMITPYVAKELSWENK